MFIPLATTEQHNHVLELRPLPNPPRSPNHRIFPRSVSQTSTSTNTSTRTFHPFIHLPSELQLHIFTFCNAPTLFQLMYTTSYIRMLTTPLFHTTFFKKPWYCIDNLSVGYTTSFDLTYLTHDAFFAQHITHLEYNFLMGLAEVSGGRGNLHMDRTQQFWARLQRLFPSVRKVVLTGLVNPNSVPLPSYADEKEEGPYGYFNNVGDRDHAVLRGVLELAPGGIEAAMAFPVDEHVAPVQLWGINKGANAREGENKDGKIWRLIDRSWNPERLMLPTRKYRSLGPMGEYVTMERLCFIASVERNGIAWLRHETHIKFPASQIAIECPNRGCSASFQERGDWETHVRIFLGDDFYEDEEFWEGPAQRCASRFLSRRTPQHVRDVLHARQKRVMEMDAQWRTLRRKLKREAGAAESEERNRF
ncbi:hypothetical protein BJX63DRAFT_429366 [Aspergillus granulosus]|uniref:F-box domain-containing protein n=1 Tax=Aspergillus granulosus TaxID=176169 RepID=A0ABR4HTG6_9EURO